jgi:trimeric autotransporter adhesin
MKRSIHEFSFIIFLLGLTSAIMFSGCDKEDDTELQNGQIEHIVIIPQSASIPVGEQFEFSTAGVTADGDTVDISDMNLGLEWNWWSTDPYIFTVDDDGIATGIGPGEAFCILDFNDPESRLKFSGRDSAFVFIF